MDSLGRFIAIIVAIILVILLPLQYVASGQGETIDNIVNTHTAEFTDTARQQGYITLDMYENLIYKLDKTGELYDIELEAAHPVSGEEVTEASLGDKMPEIEAFTTSLLMPTNKEWLFAGDTIPTSGEEKINSLAIHTHNDSCYNGTKHTCSDYGGLCYTSYSYTYYCGGCQTSTTYCSGCKTSTTYCSGCKKQYTNWISCTVCNGTGINKKGNVCGCMDGDPYGWWEYIWVCPGHTTLTCPGHTSTYCPGHTGYGYNKTCGKESGAYYNGNIRVYETCNQVVTSITATNPVQTVNKGNSIISTATATYLDGHTGIVNCSSNFNSNVVGAQTVTLTYHGLVGNAKTTGTRTGTVNVTVKVPYKLSGLTVTPSTQNITRYTNPSFTVTALYDNGTSKNITNYTSSYFSNTILGTQTVTMTYSEDGITKTAATSVIVKNLTTTCPACGGIYELDEQDMDNGCPVCKLSMTGLEASPDYITIAPGDPLLVTVNAVYATGNRYPVTGWTSNYDDGIAGIQEVTISYQGFTAHVTVNIKGNSVTCLVCGRKYALKDGMDQGCPYCKAEVVSITTSPKNVIIEKHNPLPITVVAIFRDGHTENVTDWSTDLVTDTAGTFDVSVRYKSAVDHVQVTVLDDSRIICPYCGLDYTFSESPEGCPVCSITIVGIEASLRNGGKLVPYQSSLNLQVGVIFRDEHRELAYTGWTGTGFSPDTLGEQTVTVHYKGFSTTLTIEVVKNSYEVVCPNGHEYYLNEGGIDNGCPICNEETDLSDATFYFDTTYTSDILETLYRDGIYYLEQGDYLTVKVTRRGASLRLRIQNMFQIDDAKVKKQSYLYGGEVITK